MTQGKGPIRPSTEKDGWMVWRGEKKNSLWHQHCTTGWRCRDWYCTSFFLQTKIWKFLYLPWRGAEIKIRPCREFPPCQRRTGRPTGRREATCGAVSCPWWVRHSIDGAAEDSANWLKLSSRWPIAVASSTTRGASPSPDRELLTIGPRPIPKEPHSRKKKIHNGLIIHFHSWNK